MSKELSEEGESGTNPKIVAQETTLETLTDYQKAIYELMSNGDKMQKVINQKLLERGFNSSPEKVSMNLKWMRKKGVIVIK
jgi:Mn-dependent DtxR family transcriptional regulator